MSKVFHNQNTKKLESTSYTKNIYKIILKYITKSIMLLNIFSLVFY